MIDFASVITTVRIDDPRRVGNSPCARYYRVKDEVIGHQSMDFIIAHDMTRHASFFEAAMGCGIHTDKIDASPDDESLLQPGIDLLKRYASLYAYYSDPDVIAVMEIMES